MIYGEKDKIRVLYINGGLLDAGGISAYMMNYYKNIDSSQIHIDFITQGCGDNLYVDEIADNLSLIYQVPNKGVNLMGNLMGIYRIMRDGHYDIVHSHADAGNGIVLGIAKLVGIPVRISHSHSTDFYTKSVVKRLINKFQKKIIMWSANQLWGCSESACKWLYGYNCNYEVIHNAIDSKSFLFDEDIRNQIRVDLDIAENCTALCQLGHFNYIKNQQYAVKIIKQIYKRDSQANVKLFFIGDGEDREKIQKMVDQSEIREKVYFLGVRHDVNKLLQGMDILLLPSLFEGFPVTLVESQASGLYSLVSDKVSESVCIKKELTEFLPIDDNAVFEWCTACLSKPQYARRQPNEYIVSAGFDIGVEAKKMQQKYIDLVKLYGK